MKEILNNVTLVLSFVFFICTQCVFIKRIVKIYRVKKNRETQSLNQFEFYKMIAHVTALIIGIFPIYKISIDLIILFKTLIINDL